MSEEKKDMGNNEIDWDWADEMLAITEKTYKELVGVVGVNPWFVLGSLASLRTRYDRGERNEMLYKDIEAEFNAM